MQALDKLEISDKAEHVLAYLVLAALPTLHERGRIVIAAALGAVALGIGLEYVQRYLGWRDFEVADMVADGIGVCVGVVVGMIARPFVTRRVNGLQCAR